MKRHGMRLHLGLGKPDRVDRIEVRWLGGGTDILDNVGVDQLPTITQGSSKARRTKTACGAAKAEPPEFKTAADEIDAG